MSGAYTSSDYSAEAQRIAAAGALAIRIPIKWNLVQPSSSTDYSWATVDAAVTAARGAGLAILANIEGPAPRWAQTWYADPTANGNAPADATTFKNFCQEVAKRYSSRVSAWEIWNEPNLSHYLIPPTAAAYLPILRAAYTGIRANGSQQPVITGGLSSSRAETRDTQFVSNLYQLGGRPYFNGIGVHPYTFPYPITGDPRGGDGGGAAILSSARATMIANGDSSKSVWITEYGFPTGSTSGSVTESNQASYIADALRRANSLSWIAAFIIFNSQDLTTDGSYENGNFGLYRYDGTAKPAVQALQSVVG
jgi:hypothetical protein